MIKILITSVGSLVGQNILDCLESRRNLVSIIGLNSEALNQRVFRCDKAYLVSPVGQTDMFASEFDSIIRTERPHLVLAGRDIDVVFLAKYKQEHPEVGNMIPCGDPVLAEMMLDKYESCRFAEKHNLPFAATLLYRGMEDRVALDDFIEIHGFPLVVKPRKGYASNNVFFLTKSDHINAWLEQKTEVLFQEFLGERSRIESNDSLCSKGVPLFFQIPETRQYVAQVMISPQGIPVRFITSQHQIFGGRAESLELFHNEEVDNLVMSYTEILGTKGWSGFLNLQFEKDRHGSWKVYELNPRMVGASSARLLVGFDEIGMLMKAFFPDISFPDLSFPLLKDGIVLKSLTDNYLDRSDVNKLKLTGEYTRITTTYHE